MSYPDWTDTHDVLSYSRWVRTSEAMSAVRSARVSDLSVAPSLGEIKAAILSLGDRHNTADPFVAPYYRFPHHITEKGCTHTYVNLSDNVFKQVLAAIEVCTDKDNAVNSAVNVRRDGAINSSSDAKTDKDNIIIGKYQLHQALRRFEELLGSPGNLWNRRKFETQYRLKWVDDRPGRSPVEA
nr:coat protein [Rice stripe necrosis virus]